MWFEGRTKTGKRKETVSKRPFENVVKTTVFEETRSLANPMGPFAPGHLWSLYPFATDRDRGPRKARMCKTIGKQRKTKVFPEAHEDPPDVFQITAGFPGTSVTL